MKIGKSRHAAAEPSIGPQLGITAENCVDRARAFVACRGGVGFVVRGVEGSKGSAQTGQPATEPQWLAWSRYLALKGVRTAFIRANGEATVPCEWPEDFDSDAWPSDREARVYSAPKAVDFDRKETVDRVMRRFADWGAKPPRKDDIGKPEDWLREIGARPVALSEEAKALMHRPRR